MLYTETVLRIGATSCLPFTMGRGWEHRPNRLPRSRWSILSHAVTQHQQQSQLCRLHLLLAGGWDAEVIHSPPRQACYLSPGRALQQGWETDSGTASCCEVGICLLLLSRRATSCTCSVQVTSVTRKLEGFHSNSQHQPPT